MRLGAVLAVISVVLGFVAANTKGGEIFGLNPLDWFVVAIAFVLILEDYTVPIGGRRT